MALILLDEDGIYDPAYFNVSKGGFDMQGPMLLFVRVRYLRYARGEQLPSPVRVDIQST